MQAKKPHQAMTTQTQIICTEDSESRLMQESNPSEMKIGSEGKRLNSQKLQK